MEDLKQRWERVPHGACVGGERWLSRAVRANAAEQADGPGAADRRPFGLVEATVRGGDPATTQLFFAFGEAPSLAAHAAAALRRVRLLLRGAHAVTTVEVETPTRNAAAAAVLHAAGFTPSPHTPGVILWSAG